MTKATCSADGCSRVGYAHGLCRMHYMRRWRDQTLPRRLSPVERYEAKIDRSGGSAACHPWTDHTLQKMHYGVFWDGEQRVLAHRYGWELTFGPIPDGLHVLHRCDNPPCQNPTHWFLGTNADNVADKMAKGRHRTAHGSDHPNSKLTSEDVQEIRRLAETGAALVEMARQYDVTPTQIGRIVSRQAWTHI